MGVASSVPASDLIVAIRNNTAYVLCIMPSAEKTISFRAKSEKIEALDSLAAAQDRPRSYLINEAIANYIELHAYQDALVREGQNQVRQGHVTSHDEVVKRLRTKDRASR
jgi:predicted transcriptional regulator